MRPDVARLAARFAAAPATASGSAPPGGTDPLFDLVAEPVALPGPGATLLRPRDPDALDFEPVGGGGEHAGEWHPPHWARLWPSAVALAGALAREGPEQLGGLRVLELGCGLALPSLVAARAGARVTATDLSPAAVALATVNAERNGVHLDAAVADWAVPDALLAGAPWDLVLGADVLYGHRAETLLRDLLPRLAGPGGTVLVADPGREPADRFVTSVAGWSVLSRSIGDGVALHRLRPRPAR